MYLRPNPRLVLALAFAALLASCAPGATRPAASGAGATLSVPTNDSAASGIPRFSHIFLIVMENKDYEQIIGSPKAPYLNDLARRYGLATNYYGIRHPSLPNYLALTGGSTFGITSDCTDCFVNQTNIVDQLEASGYSWQAYIESMPQACFLGDAPPLYKQKHNPFIYYDDVRNSPERCRKIVPFAQFAADLDAHTLPNYVWITPNMCDDSHDCATSDGDTWLSAWVPKILASPEWRDGGALFITFDEGDSHRPGSASCCREGNGGHVATLVISPLGKPGYRSPTAYDHYSLLRTIEDSWRLPALGASRCDCAPPMADFFEPPAAANH